MTYLHFFKYIKLIKLRVVAKCRPLVEKSEYLAVFFPKSTKDRKNSFIKGFVLTQMASFALLPSTASVFTLKSTPKQR